MIIIYVYNDYYICKISIRNYLKISRLYPTRWVPCFYFTCLVKEWEEFLVSRGIWKTGLHICQESQEAEEMNERSF